LLAKNSHHFDVLNQAAVATVRAVAPMGVTVEQCLHALPGTSLCLLFEL
jgi:16S rRNA G527 N7-methylase RsmG